MLKSKRKILFLMSGSIASYKACYLISKLVQNNFEVQVVATVSALKFVGSATLEGLTGKAVISDTFETGHAMSHIHLIRDSDLVVLCPATANTVNKMAQGVGDDLLTTLFLAHDFKKPFLLAPAMNTTMYKHPITQMSLKKLAEFGVKIMETASGVLACGENGWGKLLDPELIFNEIEEALANVSSIASKKTEAINPSVQQTKVLITSGGTSEPIDAVRSITNRSTGKTGALLAETFSDLGFDVVYLAAENAALPDRDLKILNFRSHQDLQNVLFGELEKNEFDFVIHAAAVSDFSISENQFENKKIPSAADLTLKLKSNSKIINQIKAISKNKNVKLVGFKLTADLTEVEISEKVALLFKASGADLVVSNDTAEFKWTESLSEQHRFHLWTKQGMLPRPATSKTELSMQLFHWITQQKGMFQ